MLIVKISGFLLFTTDFTENTDQTYRKRNMVQFLRLLKKIHK